jgi:hypothetical protein
MWLSRARLTEECPRRRRLPPKPATATVNVTFLLSVLVDMAASAKTPGGELPGDPDAAIRQLYSQYGKALHGYVERFCPDRASAAPGASAAGELGTAQIGGTTVLADAKGFTLYSFAPRYPVQIELQRDVRWLLAACDRDPGRRPGRDRQADHDQAVRRPDAGRLQRASPVHLHRDSTPGQTHGNNLNLNGGLWHEVTVSG